MAYYTFNSQTCMVHTSSRPSGGGSAFNGSVFVGPPMNINTFNNLYGNLLTVPFHCRIIPQIPGVTNPPNTIGPALPGHDTPGGQEAPPVAEPTDPDKCAPAAPIDEGPVTGPGSENKTNDGDFSIGEHWQEPVVAKLRGISIVEDMDDDGPVITNEAEIRRDGRGYVRAYKKASGPGFLTVLPPETDERHVYGDKGVSGKNDLSALPDKVSISGLLLLSYTDSEGISDKVQQILAWGKVVERADGIPRPANGWYAKLDNANGDLNWQATDAAGDDANDEEFKVNGRVISGRVGTDFSLVSATPRWFEVSITGQNILDTGGEGEDATITLGTLLSGTHIGGVTTKHSTSWDEAIPAWDSATFELGQTGNLDRMSSAFDVLQPAGNDVFYDSLFSETVSFVDDVDLKLTLRVDTGKDIANVKADAEVTIFVLLSRKQF